MTDERPQEALDRIVHPMHGYGTIEPPASIHARRMADWDRVLRELFDAGWRFRTPEGDEWIPPAEPREVPPPAVMLPGP